MLVDGLEQQWSNGRSTVDRLRKRHAGLSAGGLCGPRSERSFACRGREVEPLEIEPGAYLQVAMSPDGKRLAMTSSRTAIRTC